MTATDNLVACCSRFALTIKSVTESGIREWEIGLEGTDNETFDSDVVPDARQSNATLATNQACMTPPR